MKYIKTFEQFINESMLNENTKIQIRYGKTITLPDNIIKKIKQLTELEDEIKKYSITIGLSSKFPGLLDDSKWLNIQNRWEDSISNFEEKIGDVMRNKSKKDDDYSELLDILELILKVKGDYHSAKGYESESKASSGLSRIINNYKNVLSKVKSYYNNYGIKVKMNWYQG